MPSGSITRVGRRVGLKKWNGEIPEASPLPLAADDRS